MNVGEYEIANLRKLCAEKNLELVERPNGHFQIRGVMLVNYYPCARTRSLYVAGTTGALKHASAEKAVEVALGKQGFTLDNRVPRKNNYRAAKKKLLAKSDKCYWCGCKLTMQTATLDHLVPLSRGGLNNDNNYVLACEPCNKARGNNLPVGII